jgi:organic hydroperoxide reductase OsmC/OhrA
LSALQREATIRWLANPPAGLPRLMVGSHSFTSLPLNTDPEAAHPLATSPGELFAGAIGSIFVWFVANDLVREGTQAHELIVNVSIAMADEADDGSELALSAITCQLVGRIPGLDRARAETIARAALSRCLETLAIRTESIVSSVEILP